MRSWTRKDAPIGSRHGVLRVGDLGSKEELERRLLDSPVTVTYEALALIGHDTFRLSPEPRMLGLRAVTPRMLGCRPELNYFEFFRRAQRHGLERCPDELCVQAILQGLCGPRYPVLLFGTRPFISYAFPGGRILLFFLSCIPNPVLDAPLFGRMCPPDIPLDQRVLLVEKEEPKP